MLLSQGWVIGQMFDERPLSDARLEAFIRTGDPGEPASQREPRSQAVDEKVAEYFRTGKLIVE